MCGSFEKMWFVGRLLAIVAVCEFSHALFETLMVKCNSPMDAMHAFLFFFTLEINLGGSPNPIFTK
jgi:hypothetical protein